MERTDSANRRQQSRSLLGRPDRIPRWDVLEVHLDEAAFLSTQWDRALECSSRDLQRVKESVEQRLHSHLDALVVAGSKVAERLLLPALSHEDPEYIRAACMALLRSGTQRGLDSVLQTFIEGEPDTRKEAQRALELEGGAALPQRLHLLLSHAEPRILAAVLEVLRFRRFPLEASWRESLARAEAPDLQAALLREACFAPEREIRSAELRTALNTPDPAVREAALVLGLVRGQRIAWQACQQQLDARDEAGSMARLLLAVGGEDKDIERLNSLLQVPELRADVLWALGFSGRPAAAEACLPWMHDKAFASIAAEAFCSIVGLKLEGPLAKEQDPEDEELDLDGEPRPGGGAALIAPNPEAVASWWARARKGFDPTKRYCSGTPINARDLVKVLLGVPMRRRPPLALELLIRSQGRIGVEVRAWALVQWEQLHAAQVESGRLKAQPFATAMNG
ncbi:TIGR02270 family protein [Corallococcus praedator]|uniref:TIGR02270 family protein n=1 Tax=Corallococcus praedator TaxID=2316724 RepID=A0ABX9QG53_9BACT|nr:MULTISPECIES: TIGR02270 family protein [Corallococcus]RKH26652.1 TIGR02270 family protein [Corallococcus sp. CA031C]RKI06387.1 TIGR02270 family protein [Corallococcus praedator]